MPPTVDRRKHLVIFAHSSGRGGAEHSLDTMLQHLDHASWRVTVVFEREGPMAEAARQRGVVVAIRVHLWWMMRDRHPWHGPRTPLRVIKLARWLREERADLVYTNTAVIPEGAFAAWIARVPHVWHIREMLLPVHTAPTLLPLTAATRLIGWLSNRVVFVSRSARMACDPHIASAKARVIANSVRLRPDAVGDVRAAVRHGLGIPPEHIVVTWIGSLLPNKRPSLFLDAVARLDRPRVVALLVGDGPSRDQVLDHRRTLGLAEAQCQLLGFREDISAILCASDIVVSTSAIESFGQVVIEAGAFALPVIATAAQGPAEIIRDGETGFLVPIDDAARLAERLDLLAADPQLRTRMGRAAAHHVQREYDPAVNIRLLETVLREALLRAS